MPTIIINFTFRYWKVSTKIIFGRNYKSVTSSPMNFLNERNSQRFQIWQVTIKMLNIYLILLYSKSIHFCVKEFFVDFCLVCLLRVAKRSLQCIFGLEFFDIKFVLNSVPICEYKTAFKARFCIFFLSY